MARATTIHGLSSEVALRKSDGFSLTSGTTGGGTTGGGGAVPEPGEWAAMGILASGLAGLVVNKRRRQHDA